MAYVSIVVPAYNEASRIENSIKPLMRYANQLKLPYEVIIAEDGSTDGTDKIAKALAKKNKKIKSMHSRTKLGRGLALKRAFSVAKGDILCYIDADMATEPSCLKDLIRCARENDVVLGSRYIKGAVVNRPFVRIAVSRLYYWMLRKTLACNIYDFQCGFKAFSREYFEKEITHIKENGWPWDTIVIIEALKKGYKVKEIPVRWKETRDKPKNMKFTRLLDDAIVHGTTMIKLFIRWRMRIDIPF